jgi:hypothetical protein
MEEEVVVELEDLENQSPTPSGCYSASPLANQVFQLYQYQFKVIQLQLVLEVLVEPKWS